MKTQFFPFASLVAKIILMFYSYSFLRFSDDFQISISLRFIRSKKMQNRKVVDIETKKITWLIRYIIVLTNPFPQNLHIVFELLLRDVELLQNLLFFLICNLHQLWQLRHSSRWSLTEKAEKQATKFKTDDLFTKKLGSNCGKSVNGGKFKQFWVGLIAQPFFSRTWVSLCERTLVEKKWLFLKFDDRIYVYI